ncbi:vWA domain-containing protein [Allopusillimonas ginsengisoli]|uniref:vWA domain-containing protein n=1 Tax=Allopusillimonas ginsengisoli TaxID=453575 RepID=UPI0039C3BFE9
MLTSIDSPAMSDTPLAARLQSRYLGFAGFLRLNGFKYADASTAILALQYAGQLDSEVVRWTLRSALCGRAQEWQRFNALFDTWFISGSQRRRTEVRASRGRSRSLDTSQLDDLPDDSEGTPVDSADGHGHDVPGGTSSEGESPQQAFKHADFRHLHEPESLRALDELMQRFVKRLRQVELRRYKASISGRRLDLARCLRRSVSHGGFPIELAWRNRRKQLPRLILLLDVSRSMSLYSFFYLRLARVLTTVLGDVHCFIFHTRLVGIAQALRDPDPVRAQESLHLLSSGWAGGTRIGESLEQFNREYATRLLHARSCVLIASDGYDTGPSERVTDALRTMRGRARSIIWLNPLASRAGYTPASVCMQAALPFIDGLVPAGNLASLEKALPDILRAFR